jgi:hypothetical protein
MPTGQYKRKPKTIYPLKLRKAYWSMMDRCYLVTDIMYHLYGGRGVIVCDEWKGKINVFCKWAIENGWREGLQLDKDKKGNGLLYSPDTCCFLTPSENASFRQNSIKVFYEGNYRTISDISKILGISESTLRKRHAKHGHVEKIKYGKTR